MFQYCLTVAYIRIKPYFQINLTPESLAPILANQLHFKERLSWVGLMLSGELFKTKSTSQGQGIERFKAAADALLLALKN